MDIDFARPTHRDLEAAAAVRRALDAQAERLDRTNDELAAMVRLLRDVALREAGGAR